MEKFRRIIRLECLAIEAHEDMISEIMSEIEIETIQDILNESVEFKFDGVEYHWDKGEKSVTIIHLDLNQLETLEKFIQKFYGDFDLEFKIDDISKDVLLGIHDVDYGFAKEQMVLFFEKYISENLESDDILDKMIEFGKDSISKSEFSFLDGKGYEFVYKHAI